MKALYILLFLVAVNFAGCYTILWSPEEDFPSENNYYSSYEGYYSDPYYGGYNYYYEYPWWLSFSPPTVSREDEKTSRSDEIRKIRNSSGERNSSNERIAPPTRSTGSNAGSSSTGTNSSSTQTEVRNRNDNSSNSGSSSSGSRNETRNSGSRNSGNGRK